MRSGRGNLSISRPRYLARPVTSGGLFASLRAQVEAPRGWVHHGSVVRKVAPITASNGSSELLERARELSMLGECLEGVQRSSRGQVVLAGGEAGVGKTALLRRFCDEHRRSARVLWGACDVLFTPRPLGPFLDIAESTGGELAELVETGARPHEVAGVLIRELRAREATILVLEDVHSADEATLDVLRLLARRAAAVPALVLASYRDDELDRAHPLRVVLGELATGEGIGRLKLTPLSPAAVATLAEPHGVDAEELYRRTAGNPFFVTEALAAGADEIPQTVREAVLARAARLSATAQTLLGAVAVAPPQVELWLLEALAPNRRIALHRAALAALAAPPTGAPDFARLAHHAEAASDTEALLRFAPAAATRAASFSSVLPTSATSPASSARRSRRRSAPSRIAGRSATRARRETRFAR